MHGVQRRCLADGCSTYLGYASAPIDFAIATGYRTSPPSRRNQKKPAGRLIPFVSRVSGGASFLRLMNG